MSSVLWSDASDTRDLVKTAHFCLLMSISQFVCNDGEVTSLSSTLHPGADRSQGLSNARCGVRLSPAPDYRADASLHTPFISSHGAGGERRSTQASRERGWTGPQQTRRAPRRARRNPRPRRPAPVPSARSGPLPSGLRSATWGSLRARTRPLPPCRPTLEDAERELLTPHVPVSKHLWGRSFILSCSEPQRCFTTGPETTL